MHTGYTLNRLRPPLSEPAAAMSDLPATSAADPEEPAGGKPRRRTRRWYRRPMLWLLLVFVFPVVVQAARHALSATDQPWYAARHDSARLVPEAGRQPEAIVQAWAARAWGWRGIFGVHTWIAVKPAGAPAWQRLEVIGWRLYRGGSAVSITSGVPDAYWYGNRPLLLAELRGAAAADAIPRLLDAARRYPYADRYRVWPGPNSNTFVAQLARAVPELRLALPATAIGKDYPVDGRWLAPAPSGTGWQLTLGGLAGLTLAVEEGLEIDLLGLTAGIDPGGPALKLPGIGRIGPP